MILRFNSDTTSTILNTGHEVADKLGVKGATLCINTCGEDRKGEVAVEIVFETDEDDTYAALNLYHDPNANLKILLNNFMSCDDVVWMKRGQEMENHGDDEDDESLTTDELAMLKRLARVINKVVL